MKLLTACVFKSVDCVGQEADTAEETCALLFVNLLMVPHTDGDGVCLSNVTKKRKSRKKGGMYLLYMLLPNDL